MQTQASILLADASVEQLLDPGLRGQPIAVGGGVVLAASYEAKAYGVHGGMPGRKARKLCPELVFVGGHFSDYQRLGDAAIAILGDFTPLVERISIDEAFVDVAGCTHLFGAPAEIAAAIRHRVRDELGLAISVGVARTKHLAKIASQIANMPALRHLADRVASRLRAKALAGRTVTVRVRFSDMRAVTRSVTIDAPIAATTILAEIAEDLVRAALSDNSREQVITLLAISVSDFRKPSVLQLELPLGLPDEKRRPGTRRGIARWSADRAVDAIRERFGRDAIGYGAALDQRGLVPDAFRELAEKDLGEIKG